MELDTQDIWQSSGDKPVVIGHGQRLQVGQRNLIDNAATEVLWPDPASLSKGDMFSVFRGAMEALPAIKSENEGLTLFYGGETYGEAKAQNIINVPFAHHDERIYFFNGLALQEYPNQNNYDNALIGLYEQTFTTSGQFIVPQDNNLLITGVGAGAGGSHNLYFGAHAGSSAAGVVDEPVTYIPAGTVLNIAIGASGVYGTQNSEPTAGGNTSLGDILILEGGKPSLNRSTNPDDRGAPGRVLGTHAAVNGFDGVVGGLPGVANHDTDYAENGIAGPSLGDKVSGIPGQWVQTSNGLEHAGNAPGAPSILSDGARAGNGYQNGYNAPGPGAGGGGGNYQQGGYGGPGKLIIKWGPKGVV